VLCVTLFFIGKACVARRNEGRKSLGKRSSPRSDVCGPAYIYINKCVLAMTKARGTRPPAYIYMCVFIRK